MLVYPVVFTEYPMKRVFLRTLKHEEARVAGHSESFVVLYGERIKYMEMPEASIEATEVLMDEKQRKRVE